MPDQRLGAMVGMFARLHDVYGAAMFFMKPLIVLMTVLALLMVRLMFLTAGSAQLMVFTRTRHLRQSR